MADKFTRGMPFVPGRVETFELACNEMWRALRRLSVEQLKELRPTGPYVALIDALIDVRLMMDGGAPAPRASASIEHVAGI